MEPAIVYPDKESRSPAFEDTVHNWFSRMIRFNERHDFCCQQSSMAELFRPENRQYL